MILFTPLALPKFEIYDWDAWWDMWNKFATFTERAIPTHNKTAPELPWKGIDLYTTKTHNRHYYTVPIAPTVPVVKILVESIIDQIPIIPTLIRVIENTCFLSAHTDNPEPTGEVRVLLWNTYKTPIWELELYGENRPLILPPDTNSFWYLDNPLKHIAMYDKTCSKGLLQVYGVPKSNYLDLISNSAKIYGKFAWVENIGINTK